MKPISDYRDYRDRYSFWRGLFVALIVGSLAWLGVMLLGYVVLCAEPPKLEQTDRQRVIAAAQRLNWSGQTCAIYQRQGNELTMLVWPDFYPGLPAGACDSDEECEDKTDQMCRDAGHGGVDADTVEVIELDDGGSTCSGTCSDGSGAIAFVLCDAPNSGV